jgi:GNAT superfamily N-acetyltransferase
MNDEIHVAEIGNEECDDALPEICGLFPVALPENEREAFRFYASDSGNVLLVARVGATAVGLLAGSFPVTVDFAGRIARVDSLLVHRQWRRQGIATSLLEDFRARARARGCGNLVADVPCREGREAARRFWESHHLRASDLHQFSASV